MVKKKVIPFNKALDKYMRDHMQYDNFSNIDFNNGAMFAIKWILKNMEVVNLITQDRDGKRCIEKLYLKKNIEDLLK